MKSSPLFSTPCMTSVQTIRTDGDDEAYTSALCRLGKKRDGGVIHRTLNATNALDNVEYNYISYYYYFVSNYHHSISLYHNNILIYRSFSARSINLISFYPHCHQYKMYVYDQVDRNYNFLTTDRLIFLYYIVCCASYDC